MESATGGDPDITAGLRNVWKDRSPGLQQQTQQFSDKRVWEFIEKAMASRKA